MTLTQVYLQGKRLLTEVEVDSPAFDAMCIFKFCFGIDRQGLILHGNDIADERKSARFFELIHQRATSRPLQYILGAWEFMGVEFKVGEGILIPRGDTEALVSKVLSLIEDIKNPKILDLCTGPGPIAITLAKRRVDASVFAVELSEVALRYLQANINLNAAENVTPLRFDVLLDADKFNFNGFDIIVSNPPYIATSELKSLQKEVLSEPQMALNGGSDGLVFYHAIAKNWVKLLLRGGYLCVEVGIGQALAVADIFKAAGLDSIEVVRDLNGIDRVVTAKKL